MAERIPFEWNKANFNWNATSPTDGKSYPSNLRVTGTNKWDDCALIIEIITAAEPVEYLNTVPAKKKQFIKILCKIQGKEFKETKEIHKTKIFIKDIELVAKEVLGINIKIEK